jgi:UDP-N-acetylmuramoyl-tripeptide--D-alanyl-D-alanine ligase
MPSISVEALYDIFLQHPYITTDTRKINQGDIFFALKGHNFNANDFSLQAIKEGAAYAVVDDATLPPHDQFLFCDDVLTMLQNLAGFHRNKFSIPIIAITGSNGKTTTKELVHTVLSAKYKTSTTQGNLNNHIGIPLTLLRVPPDAEMVVVEMGANHQKEIEGYCTYAKPTHGMITNCGKAHLEGFGGEAGVRKGKGELFDFLKENHSHAFVCMDFDYFHSMVEDRNMNQVIWYGMSKNATITGHVLSAAPFLQVEITDGFAKPLIIETQLVGDYNLFNILAAVTIGQYFGVSSSEIQNAIAGYHPDNSRSQLIKAGGNTIILDAYNANPSSMTAAITNFAHLQADKKILMLGAMAELGEESLEEHKSLVALIDQYEWDKVVLVGGDFGKVTHKYIWFETSAEAATWWKAQKMERVYLLLKGSRSMAMEKVLAK